MTRHVAAFVIAVLLPSFVLGKAGAEIPRPELSLSAAVRAVEGYFVDAFQNEPRDPAFERFKRECIVQRVDYTDRYSDGSFDERPGDRDVKLGEWSWVITIIHPRENDHTWVFQLRRNGTIKLLAHSV